jgi:hypothetical protein
VIPRNNERWYGSAVRSAKHGISKENGAQQFHRDCLDFLLLLLLLYQDKRWEIIFCFFTKIGAFCYSLILENIFSFSFFFSIDEKNQKSRLILIYLNSKLNSTHAPRPLRSLGAYRFIQFEFLRKLKVCRF